MTKEELIASYPEGTAAIFIYVIMVSILFLIMALAAAMHDQKIDITSLIGSGYRLINSSLVISPPLLVPYNEELQILFRQVFLSFLTQIPPHTQYRD